MKKELVQLTDVNGLQVFVPAESMFEALLGGDFRLYGLTLAQINMLRRYYSERTGQEACFIGVQR